ncbi:MAG: hypothetical protein HMLKMBBP_01365 [Planctomycetes bacterium]|nr:hypothetical protein [Planctomycetota bacterium]
MARSKVDPAVLAHLEWIGFVRPTGLVVSAPALVRAGAILERRDADGQRRLVSCLYGASEVRERAPAYGGGEVPPPIQDFRRFATDLLGWDLRLPSFAGTDLTPVPADLEVPLRDYGETLRPDLAVREPDPRDAESPWQLLVSVVPQGHGLDDLVRGRGRLEASPHGRMERMLRERRVPAGLLVNGSVLRLVSAPRGENSGWIDFRVADMVQPAGRPICTALRLLLGQSRLLSLPRAQRLAALLADSRRFQNEVSDQLGQQVLHALYELVRGFQAAHDHSKGALLRDVLARDPDEVYRSLLTVILRLIFLLYAEERDLLPRDEVFLRGYSLGGLYERLRADASLHPDTMDQRYGAWVQLLVLFRMLHDGAEAGALRLPARHGVLFDPDRYPFLEGRSSAGGVATTRYDAPLVSDGTIWRALEKLLVLDGERISYRTLDVAHIGSVYERMMGFRMETATGRSVAIRSQDRHGAPTTLDLERLLGEDTGKRAKAFLDTTGRKLTDTVRKTVVAAATIEDLHAALEGVADHDATPDLVPKGAMVLQPSEERRRSGSHYTPPALTEPIVRTALEPILSRLRGADGRAPRPDALLELRVLDPAMGSGAFLVEACRQIGDALVESWHAHGEVPQIPADEDEVIHARRRVAQKCLYGVDRNPVAVDLAKVSLWLTTLARDHALTFVDHALRHGDSLVGLSRRQVERFHWDESAPVFQQGFATMRVAPHLARIRELRGRIRDADDGTTDAELRALWSEAEVETNVVRHFGDLVVSAFFDGENGREREAKRGALALDVVERRSDRHREGLDRRRRADPPLAPFHWELEFPEVFDEKNPGFDAVVGNPPFAGKNTLAHGNLPGYPDWLKTIHEESHGNADLVAQFFRRGFNLLRKDGTFGLIATNTIAQGDTRSTGLRWICKHGGEIYEARKRVKWPGLAAVVVSVVHVAKGPVPEPKRLDERQVERITAFLFHRGGNDDPARLMANAGKSFQGSIVLGMGFTFDDTDTKGIATPIAEMRRLIDRDPRNQDVIFPYIGGEEVNDEPEHRYHRYVINFFDRDEDRCRERWPDLMQIVEAKVRPEREVQTRPALRERWWQYAEKRPGLCAAVSRLDRVLATCRHQPQWALAFLPSKVVCAESLIVFPLTTFAAFCSLQSRCHETWARFFGSSLEDRLRYTPSDCFETFPFPENWETDPRLEVAGRAYYEFRADLMVRNNEGLTKTYNRFHDENEHDPQIERLRTLHAEMDRAVLDAHGWRDLDTRCDYHPDFVNEDGEPESVRYRWSDETRDEVLARLLELNAARAAAEARSGAADAPKGARKSRKMKTDRVADLPAGGLDLRPADEGDAR